MNIPENIAILKKKSLIERQQIVRSILSHQKFPLERIFSSDSNWLIYWLVLLPILPMQG